jgi:hypothetical protein
VASAGGATSAFRDAAGSHLRQLIRPRAAIRSMCTYVIAATRSVMRRTRGTRRST